MYAYKNVNNTEFSKLFCFPELITIYTSDCIFSDYCLCIYKDSIHICILTPHIFVFTKMR